MFRSHRSGRFLKVSTSCDTPAATLVALTPTPAAVDLREVDFAGLTLPITLLVGAEGPGLTAPTLAAADLLCRIPMAPGIDSLNIATAAAVVLSRIGP